MTPGRLVRLVLGAVGVALLVPAAAPAAGPRPQVMEIARQSWECARRAGEVEGSLLTVIDSTSK